MEKGKEVLESSSQNKRPRMTRGADKGGSQGAPADSARGKGKEDAILLCLLCFSTWLRRIWLQQAVSAGVMTMVGHASSVMMNVGHASGTTTTDVGTCTPLIDACSSRRTVSIDECSSRRMAASGHRRISSPAHLVAGASGRRRIWSPAHLVACASRRQAGTWAGGDFEPQMHKPRH
ncbi:hypothetical protein ABZP36_010827 [Zizania latifolia]